MGRRLEKNRLYCGKQTKHTRLYCVWEAAAISTPFQSITGDVTTVSPVAKKWIKSATNLGFVEYFDSIQMIIAEMLTQDNTTERSSTKRTQTLELFQAPGVLHQYNPQVQSWQKA